MEWVNGGSWKERRASGSILIGRDEVEMFLVLRMMPNYMNWDGSVDS